jgi:hypothetical protein
MPEHITPAAASPGAAGDPWSWLDLGSAQARTWLEWQGALWQPCWDAQAQWLQAWQDCWPMLVVRGGEQLG